VEYLRFCRRSSLVISPKDPSLRTVWWMKFSRLSSSLTKFQRGNAVVLHGLFRGVVPFCLQSCFVLDSAPAQLTILPAVVILCDVDIGTICQAIDSFLEVLS